MRTFRRDGVGARASMDLIEMHPGQWEIAASERTRLPSPSGRP
jgi:predicted acetyltransferase